MRGVEHEWEAEQLHKVILVTTITLKRLMQRSYESMLSYYETVSPQFNEPLYLPAGRASTRPVRTVV